MQICPISIFRSAEHVTDVNFSIERMYKQLLAAESPQEVQSFTFFIAFQINNVSAYSKESNSSALNSS